MVTLGAQIHEHFHLDDSLAQVGLGKNAAKAPFSPEECVCSGLTGLPRKDRQRVNYTGFFKNINNLPFTQTFKQIKARASHCSPGLYSKQQFGLTLFLD